jgi:hypothetical protein
VREDLETTKIKRFYSHPQRVGKAYITVKK